MTDTIDGITALERAYEELERRTAALPDSGLDGPSGCAGWEVRALLDHVLRAKGAHGAPVAVPDSASIQDRLLGLLGRRP